MPGDVRDMVLRCHLCHRCVCVCHMVLLPKVCVCHMRAVTPSLSQVSLSPFPAPYSRCPNACVRRGKAWGGGAGQKACALLVVLDLLQLGPCRITHLLSLAAWLMMAWTAGVQGVSTGASGCGIFYRSLRPWEADASAECGGWGV
jgi:hypothetical protein